MLNRRLGAVTLAAAIAAGCGGDALAPPGGGGEPEPDFDRLFAPATGAEIASVRAEWMSRNPAATDARVEAAVATSFGGMQGEATIIAHRVDGNLHYGALFVPDGAPPGAPIVVFLHGGEGGVSLPQTDTDFLIGGLGPIRDRMTYLIPSFRSEELRVGGQSFRSEGSQSPWDRDVDDAIALVRSAAALLPQSVDPGRVVTLGVSRGALVALLMAIRDPDIAGTIELAGPTDFFGDFVRAVIEEAARGDPRQVAGLAYFDSRFIQPWVRGELSTEAFRLELVRRSAVLFGEDVPRLQVHHGTSDPVVAPSQAQSLISTMQSLGRTPPGFESFLYSGVGHAITGFGAAPDRARTFLEELWFPAAAIADLAVMTSGPSQAAVDDTITYVIATRNEGPQSAAGVSLVDTLPPGAAFVRASRGATASGRVVRWPELASLASGGTRVDTVVAVVRSSGSLTAVAAVTSATTDPDASDNRASVTTSVAAPGPDLDALFANPTSGEISAVRSLWAGRSPSSQNPSLVQSIQVTSSGVTGQLHVIEHTVDGLRHYGSVFVPKGIASGSAPIIVFLHGGSTGTSTPGGDLD
ncbi:MAG: prolyl oligopeptidase family serine peptidase, partial [Gemmatimonadota bacterium]|nr:prolyl oligopeptidase family serine peptidase [Gemmatimonadota bacterium]